MPHSKSTHRKGSVSNIGGIHHEGRVPLKAGTHHRETYLKEEVHITREEYLVRKEMFLRKALHHKVSVPHRGVYIHTGGMHHGTVFVMNFFSIKNLHKKLLSNFLRIEVFSTKGNEIQRHERKRNFDEDKSCFSIGHRFKYCKFTNQSMRA